MSIDALTLNVQELEAKVKSVQEELAAKEGEPARIQADIEEARRQRGEAVARGLDLGTISRTIKKHREDLELAEDTLEGLKTRYHRLREELAQAEEDLREAQEEEELSRLGVAVEKYNTLARQLAPTLAEIHTRRQRLQETRYKGGCSPNTLYGGWDHSILDSVPALYLQGQERPPYNSDSSFLFKVRADGRMVVDGALLPPGWDPDNQAEGEVGHE